MAIPGFQVLSDAFPDYWKYPRPEAVKKLIGGGVNSSDITNTCTIRLSHAMNWAGVPIPEKWQGVTSRKGQNGQFYIVRVANFWPWMEFRFGPPDRDLDFHKKAGAPFDRTRIPATEGIIGFEIGFGNATGHFDLWYENEFSHEDNGGSDYFARATRISLWTTGIRISRAPV